MVEGAMQHHHTERRKAPTQLNVHGQLKRSVEVGYTRAFVVIAMILCCYLAVMLRIINLAILTDAPKKMQYSDAKPVLQKRADIVDSNGILLATDIETQSLYANPSEIKQPKKVAQQLALLLPGVKRETLEKRLASQRKFAWIKRNLHPKKVLEVNELGIAGVYFQKEWRRSYLYKDLFTHAIGKVNVDGKGISGLEGALDSAFHEENAAAMQLTLDARVQHAVADSLEAQRQKHRAKAAVGMVMHAKTGAVKAMVSLPSYDPNKGMPDYKLAEFNHATKGLYEMGSTFKPFTIAAALEAGKTSLTKWYDVKDPIKVSRFTIKDYHPIKEPVQISHILQESSNIGTVKIARAMQLKEQQDFLETMGFFERIDSLEVIERSRPIMPERWGDATRATVSYGHGIAVTPLHITTAFAQLVNGGQKVFPTLVKHKAVPSHIQLFSEETSDDMRMLLRSVVSEGTGKKAGALGYQVGGKTGTAEKPSSRGYAERKLVSSFIGAFPMDAPEYVVLILLDEPHATEDTYGFATAGWVAAPVVKDVVERIAPLLGVQPTIDNGTLQPKVGI